MKVNKWTESWTKDCLGLCVPIDGGKVVIVQVPQQPDALFTVIHEAVHVWQFICQYMQETNPGDETEAYTIEFIVKELLKHYERLTGDPDALHARWKA
jgi:hypothetical protein